MFCTRKTIELPKKDSVIQLRPLGDIHLGNLGCDIDKFMKSVDTIANNDDYITIGMGDYIDNVMAYANGAIDKRWNPETVDRRMLTTEEQTDVFLQAWEPIKHKTLGLSFLQVDCAFYHSQFLLLVLPMYHGCDP